MTTVVAEQRDDATVKALGWVALSLVVGWAGVGVLDGAVRFVDAIRLSAAIRRGRGWSTVLPLGADLLLGMLWMVAVGCLAVGAAVGVAALVVRGRSARGVVFLLVVALGGVAQFLFVQVDASAGWGIGNHNPLDPDLLPSVGLLLVPLAVLVATLAFLGPALRTPRSSPEPTAAG